MRCISEKLPACYNYLMSDTIKTKVNDGSVEDFIDKVENDTRRQDAFKVLEIYERVTKEPAKMWGTAIIGFGVYHVSSGGKEADWPLAGFSPRKQNLTLYVDPENVDLNDLLKDLGKHKTSKACLYINKLSDVDLDVLEKIVERAYLSAKKNLA